MNVSELCRICMNIGSYLLTDQQLEDGMNEINSEQMLREFSDNEVCLIFNLF